MDPTNWFSIADIKLIGAGAVGGVVAALTKRGHWREKLRVFAIGTLSAYFLAPLVLPILRFLLNPLDLEIDESRIAGMSGFLAGALAVVIIEVLIRAMQRRIGAPVEEATE